MSRERVSDDPGSDAPTEPTPVLAEEERPGLHVRMFGSQQFFRLWLTQVVSATGDWLGFLAIAALATRIGAGSPEAAVGVVMAARIVPGFFLGPASGVIADRFDRKRVMVVCDIGRASVLALLPFVDTVFGLVVASLVLEIFTMLWTPAKEASVPNIVPTDHLTTANSLSLVAAYGTMPLAAGLFSLLSKVAEWVGEIDSLGGLKTDQETIAFFVDSATFLFSAFMISRIRLPRLERTQTKAANGRRVDFAQAFRELKEGWQFIFVNPVVRAVNLGLATGLIGGGMLVPLGPVFSLRVLNAGTAGFGFFIFALGCGVAIGVVLLSVFQRRIPKAEVFAGSLLVAGAALIAAASMSELGLAALFVAVLGVCAGSVYVLGFTLLHESVDDDLRGRIFERALHAGPLLHPRGVRGRAAPVGPARQAEPPLPRPARRPRRVRDRGAGRAPDPLVRRAHHHRRRHHRGPLRPPDGRGGPARAARGDRHRLHRAHHRGEAPPRPTLDHQPRWEGRAVTGRLIAFEGGEGSGKSTQAARLAERLGALLTHEPGDTPLGAAVRGLLLDGDLEVTPRAEALLMAADRAQHVTDVIRPALAAGRTVITDRYTPSSIAYQGYGRQLDPAEIANLSAWATQELAPDLVLLLEVPLSVSRDRTGGARDRLEAAGPDFHRRVHDGFLQQAITDPERFAVIDGTQDEDVVADAVWQVVALRFPDLT